MIWHVNCHLKFLTKVIRYLWQKFTKRLEWRKFQTNYFYVIFVRTAVRKRWSTMQDSSKTSTTSLCITWSSVVDDDKNFLSWQDPFIRSAILFIKLGCYNFAELGLDEYYKTRGVSVNHSYLLAVINAMKGDCRRALIHLDNISQKDVGNHQVNYEVEEVWSGWKFSRRLWFHRRPDTEALAVIFHARSNTGKYEKAKAILTQANRIFPS